MAVQTDYWQDEQTQEEAPAQEVKPKRKRNTSSTEVTVKVNRKIYEAAKRVSALTGQNVSELISVALREGITTCFTTAVKQFDPSDLFGEIR